MSSQQGAAITSVSTGFPPQPARSDPARPAGDDTPRWLSPRSAVLLAGCGGMALGGALAWLLAVGLQTGLGFVDDPGLQLAPGAETLSAAGAGQQLVANVGPAPRTELVVDVAGAVVKPGLHRLRDGDRVGDAIAAAGGFSPQADIAEASRTLNLAQPLTDGGKILVPELGAGGFVPGDGVFATGSEPVDDGLIDLNAADQARLETLPGIGPVTAARIIESRVEEPFTTVRELRARGVVGAAVYDRIKAMVRVQR